jgi:AcrR family transcriptional regulator
MTGRRERKERTRRELLHAARTVIADKGFPATTARDVATRAGVAVGTVFVHFPTMARLAETILDELVGDTLAAADADLPETGLIDQLVHVGTRLYDAYAGDPELSRQVIGGSLFETMPDGPSAHRLAELRAWVIRRVEAAVAAGEIPPISGLEAFAGFFALYFGVLAAGLRGELDPGTQGALLRSLLIRLFRPKAGD